MTTALFSDTSSTTPELSTSTSESLTKKSGTSEEISYPTDQISDTSETFTTESPQFTKESENTEPITEKSKLTRFCLKNIKFNENTFRYTFSNITGYKRQN